MVQRPALSPDRSLALCTNIFGVLPDLSDQAAAFITKMLHAQLQRGSAAEQIEPIGEVNKYLGGHLHPGGWARPRRVALPSTPRRAVPLRAGLGLRLRCGAGAGRGPLRVLGARMFSLRAASGNRSEQCWDRMRLPYERHSA